ncbi:transcription factor [Aspergillus neoniger CBS 115656]|uniref:Fungal-specific transcription factor n=1 Tax=Aspergillus neoniger (strain CBS 115656) TaxID=1448310 RepID=A0A318YXX7_ASPNB|nr:fungal-specific transcription factor [Aspergillus neoniger CBS 115656]PYH36600.1 fungal-specific transcription factor [Aspergillus neoniger CBS 115656]
MATEKPTYRIASIPGDGIGEEVVRATIEVVNKLAQTLKTFNIEFTHLPWGTEYYKQHGRYVSEGYLDTLRKFDAGLFGSVGHPDVPDHVSLWGLLLALRSPLQLYANVRPVRTFPGTKSPLTTAVNGIDWVLVRENSEGEYCGQGGRSHTGQPWEAATEVAIFTRVGVERIMRFAFETARSRPRRHLTVVTKSNAMRYGMVLWDEVAEAVAKDFPDVTWDKMLVDAMTLRMISKPDSLDTIVGTNLHMDILSDLAAGLAGSIGVAPSSNLDPTRKNPSLFEPVHGSAFDIMGKGVANPVATFWSAAEMLAWLGEKDASKKLMDCVEKVCAAGVLTPDLGGSANTQGVVDAVCKEIEQQLASIQSEILDFNAIFSSMLSPYPRRQHHDPTRMEPPDLTNGPSEIGSLTAHSKDESQFVGSSSGVYFINTVRRAFSESLDPSGSSPAQDFPQPEDTLVGSDASQKTTPAALQDDQFPSQWAYDPAVAAVLGNAPPLDTARELMMMYFKVWHPLFPFLHGPTFLQAMEGLYSEDRQEPTGNAPMADHRHVCWTTIFQCIFNLANAVHPDIQLPLGSRIESPSNMHSLLGTLTSKHDMLSLQALLACQLYLLAKMSLRTASTVGGCMLRSMLHAGLHRCPYRYKELTTHDRQLRKRIFWCAYAIDRYLSQALGLPLGVQDSDIDVCSPNAPEIHIPGMYNRSHFARSASYPEQRGHRPQLTSNQHHANTSPRTFSAHSSSSAEEAQQNRRELAFASYVESGTLTGRALELFHKSITVRSVPRSSVLFLITDVHKWWNNLSIETLQGQHQQSTTDQPSSSSPTATTTTAFNFAPFFTVLYQHLILLINRPSLSLSPTTPEFCSGLQTCINAAREIISALTTQQESGQSFFWPGFLSAAWMSGLVLAFACQLRQYVLSKGAQEIAKCLTILHTMSTQWEAAKHCHRALSLLSRTIQESGTNTTAGEGSPNKRRKVAVDPHHTAFFTPINSLSSTNMDDEYARGRAGRRTPAAAAAATTSGLHETANTSGGHVHLSHEDRLFAAEGVSTNTNDNNNGDAVGEFDFGIVDLLEGSNFDDLADMFGQQYPSF